MHHHVSIFCMTKTATYCVLKLLMSGLVFFFYLDVCFDMDECAFKIVCLSFSIDMKMPLF